MSRPGILEFLSWDTRVFVFKLKAICINALSPIFWISFFENKKFFENNLKIQQGDY
jgi:hypothetical protein